MLPQFYATSSCKSHPFTTFTSTSSFSFLTKKHNVYSFSGSSLSLNGWECLSELTQESAGLNFKSNPASAGSCLIPHTFCFTFCSNTCSGRTEAPNLSALLFISQCTAVNRLEAKTFLHAAVPSL